MVLRNQTLCSKPEVCFVEAYEGSAPFVLFAKGAAAYVLQGFFRTWSRHELVAPFFFAPIPRAKALNNGWHAYTQFKHVFLYLALRFTQGFTRWFPPDGRERGRVGR